MISISYQFVSYLWISLTLFTLMIILIVFALQNITVLGAHSFLLTLVLVEIWIVAQALEMAATGLQLKLFWANIQYVPIMLIPVTYLYLSLQYTRRENLLRLRWLPFLLLLAPLVFNLLAWTNGSHGLIRQNVFLDLSGAFPTVAKTYGPLFWFFAAYNYAISLFSIIILIQAFREKHSLYRKQIGFLIAALLLPVLSNLVQLFGLNPFRVAITPSFIGLAAVLISVGIFRYRLFDVVPITRSAVIQKMKTGMVVLDRECRILDINPAARTMLNLESNDPIGKSVRTELASLPDVIHICEQKVDAVCEVVQESGKNRHYYEVSFIGIGEREQFSGWLLQIYDITERKLAEEIIQYSALHDDLTGLPNRSYFQVLSTQELALARMRGNFLAVAFLDLDNFKIINDTYGHDAGDRVLREVAKRLEGILHENDLIARIGGDEFAIVLPKAAGNEAVAAIGRQFLSLFEQPVSLREAELPVQASIGFSLFPRDGDQIETLLKKADNAMYRVKRNRKNDFCVF